MGGGGPSKESSTTTTALPDWVQPYVQNFLSQANNTVLPGNQTAPYPYPNQQVAPFSGMQQYGMDTVAAMGNQSPQVNQAIQTASDQMAAPNPVNSNQVAGSFNNAFNMQNNLMNQNAIQNPLLSQYFNQAAGDVTGQMNAAALKSGAFGSSGAVDATGKTLDNLAAQIYTPAWNQQEQLRQMAANYAPTANASMNANTGLQQQAAYMSPYLMQSSYFPAQMMMNTGGQQQAQAQNILNTGYQNQYNQANWPFQALSQLQGYLGLGTGAGGTQNVNVKAS